MQPGISRRTQERVNEVDGMTYKVLDKKFDCHRDCGFNCCSEIFLDLPPGYKKSFEENGYFIAGNNYSDYEWLGYHDDVVLEKLPKGNRKISIKPGIEFELIFNPFRGYEMLRMNSVCNKLESDGRCKIYRSRPEICKAALCTVFTDKPTIKWFAQNGVLRDILKKYEDTE
jgi:Fe-S-cluster containining protein